MRRFRLKLGASGIALVIIASGLWCFPGSDCRAEENSPQPPPAAAEAAHSPESDPPPVPAIRMEKEGEAEPTAPGESASPDPAGMQSGGITYTVRHKDSLSAVAQLYGLDPSELARANHIDEDTALEVGQTLKIPNPFAAQVHHLEGVVQKLTVEADTAKHSYEAQQARVQALSDQNVQLAAAAKEAEHGVRTLPWWRGLALTAGAAALLMLGVTALTMLEWLILRRRFRALAEMNEAIRRLDQKYKVALAKTELRLQQLYGRRKGAENQDRSLPSPDEIEIERLNQQLKELMRRHLERLGLGATKSGRRSRIRDLIGGTESLAEARADRR
jgi:LysM repeat protein